MVQFVQFLKPAFAALLFPVQPALNQVQLGLMVLRANGAAPAKLRLALAGQAQVRFSLALANDLKSFRLKRRQVSNRAPP